MSWENVRLKLIGIHGWLDNFIKRYPYALITLYVAAFSALCYIAYDTRQQIVDSEAGRKQSQVIRETGHD